MLRHGNIYKKKNLLIKFSYYNSAKFYYYCYVKYLQTENWPL